MSMISAARIAGSFVTGRTRNTMAVRTMDGMATKKILRQTGAVTGKAAEMEAGFERVYR